MARDVGIRELKNRTSAVVDEVAEGATVIVTRRGQPVARLTPIGPNPVVDELLARGRLRWSGHAPDLPRAVRLSGGGPTIAEQVIADRGPR